MECPGAHRPAVCAGKGDGLVMGLAGTATHPLARALCTLRSQAELCHAGSSREHESIK